MNRSLCATLRTAAGNPENQDRGAVIPCGPRLVLVIADGAGGLSGGAEAAEMAVSLVRQDAELLVDSGCCSSALQKMDQSITRDTQAGETTCALAVVSDEQVFGASVGDSGVWVIGETGLTDLTRGQSRKPFIGSGSAWPAPFARPAVSGEYLLLATDGLLKYAPPERIVAACRGCAAEAAAQRLIELVRYPSGALPDDVTVILARL
jgi:serine/threonine protein phosphatase PrpC